MGKKILVLGTGAQGSTVAQRMDEEPNVDEIICADYDKKAVNAVVSQLKKGKGVRVDASKKENIVEIAKGADLIVNALPLAFGKKVLDAALEVKADYQDFATPETPELHESWIEGFHILLSEYSEKFAANGNLAICGTGSAPGLIMAASRLAVKDLDTCDTIYNIVWEGAEAKRFQPFWWSPVSALIDMSGRSYAYIDGQIVRPEAFSLPIKRQYDYMDKEIEFVEHEHDEPVQIGINADTHFKGCKNAYFKYAGAGIDFAKPLYRAGLLSREPEDVNGTEVIPFNLVLKHLPAAPKYKDEIKEIIDEGLVSDAGCMVVEAYGQKDGRDVKNEVHVFAPGVVESYEKAGITAEMYLTGQGGALFTKMFVNDKYDQKGLITSDMLTYDEIDYYFDEAAKLDITLDIRNDVK